MTSSKRHCLLMTFANFNAKVYRHIVIDYSVLYMGPSPRPRGSARPKTASSVILHGHV